MALYVKTDDCANCSRNDPCSCPLPQITSALTASNARFTSFSYTITATESPTSFAATGLPAGFSLNASTGVITGTMPDCGVTNISISAANACGFGPSKVLVLTSTGVAPAITSASQAAAFLNESFSFTITATNSPTSFSATNLPPGLTLNTSTGVISGTPANETNYNVNLSASNACGTGTANLTIVIAGQPVLMCDSIEASFSKAGFTENTGYISNPPRYYRRLSASGTMTQELFAGPDCTTTPLPNNVEAYSGFQEYDNDGNLVVDAIAINGVVIPGIGNLPVSCDTVECIPVDTSTTRTYTGNQVCYNGFPAFKYVGSVVSTFSNEFTTAELITLTVAELPAYPGSFNGVCSAFRDLESNEITYTIRRFKYKFQLPNLTGFLTFQIDWLEGGTARTYVWNGSDTETGVYTVNEPVGNGIIQITNVVISGT